MFLKVPWLSHNVFKSHKKAGFHPIYGKPIFEKPQSPLPSLAFVSVKGKQGQAGFIVNCTSVKGTFILAVFWSKAKIF